MSTYADELAHIRAALTPIRAPIGGRQRRAAAFDASSRPHPFALVDHGPADVCQYPFPGLNLAAIQNSPHPSGYSAGTPPATLSPLGESRSCDFMTDATDSESGLFSLRSGLSATDTLFGSLPDSLRCVSPTTHEGDLTAFGGESSLMQDYEPFPFPEFAFESPDTGSLTPTSPFESLSSSTPPREGVAGESPTGAGEPPARRMTDAERARALMTPRPAPRAGQLPAHMSGGLAGSVVTPADSPVSRADSPSPGAPTHAHKHFRAVGMKSPPLAKAVGLSGGVVDLPPSVATKKPVLPAAPVFDLTLSLSDLPVLKPEAARRTRKSKVGARVGNADEPRTVVRDGRTMFACSAAGCSFLSLRRQHLKNHETTHLKHGDPQKKLFGCNLCDRAFAQKSHLKRHVGTVHEGGFKYACAHASCDHKCNQKSNLATHLSRVHKDYSLQPYACPLAASHHCDNRFSTEGGVYAHLRKTHHVADARVRFANLVRELGSSA